MLLGRVLLMAGEPADFRAGPGSKNINPPLGTPLAGYYHERPSDGVLDDLFAKALVLDDGQTKAAIVVCDLITIPRTVALAARKLVAERTDIPAAHVLLAATHSHTGPVLLRGSVLDDATGASNSLCRQYTVDLPSLIADAVVEALNRCQPSKVSFALETETQLAFNRRFWMKDGTLGWNPGKLNPDILRVAGPIDPEVGVVYFETADQQPLLTFVNFAMHPDTTGGARLSADYPGALSRRLADYKGPEMLTLFANGACGNINHVNVRWPARQASPNEANRLGTILSAAVLKAYMHLKPVDDLRLQVRSTLLQLPLAPITGDDLEQAKAVAAQGKTARFLERVQAYKVLDVAGRQGEPLEVEVQAITLGRHLAWVSMPGEFFVEPGLNLKAASPFHQTHIIELANGSIGYIPDRPAYAEGNYEVVSARCAAGSAEMLVGVAIKLLEEMYP